MTIYSLLPADILCIDRIAAETVRVGPGRKGRHVEKHQEIIERICSFLYINM